MTPANEASMIQIKTDAEIAKMRAAGLVVGRTLALLAEHVAPGVSTGELDELAEKAILGEGAIPSFKGYHGYPATICASVNHQIVHGIPSRGQVLREGDIVSLDCGAILDGWHGDSAVTLPVGEISPELQRLIAVTEESMWRGVAAARLGGRVSDISSAIETYARPFGYGIVEEYTGHGIGTEMHQEPAVPNFGKAGRGPEIVQGLALAVEPMLNLGKRQTRLLDDGWTVVTKDGLPSAHFEHTFTVTDQGPLVLTALDGGISKLSALSSVG
jgi:methionyl aminopeptidase